MTKESELSQEDVWHEHLEQVKVPQHWGYMLGVLGGGFVAMVLFIALLGQSV